MKIQNFLSLIKNFLGINIKNANKEKHSLTEGNDEKFLHNEIQSNQTYEIKNYINDLLKNNQFTKLKEVLDSGIILNETQNNLLYQAFEVFLNEGGTGNYLKNLNSSDKLPVTNSDISSLSLIPFIPAQIEITRTFFKEFSFKSKYLAIGAFAYFLDKEAYLHSNVGVRYSEFPEETFELFFNMLAINYPEPIKGMERIVPKELFVHFLVDYLEIQSVKPIISKIVKNHQLEVNLEKSSYSRNFLQSFFKQLPIHHMVHTELFIQSYTSQYTKLTMFFQSDGPLFKKNQYSSISNYDIPGIIQSCNDNFSADLDNLFNQMSESFNTHNSMMDKIKKQLKESRFTNITLDNFVPYITQTPLPENLKNDLINAGKILNQISELNTSQENKHYTQQILKQLLQTVDTSLQMKEIDLIDDSKIKELLTPIMADIIESFKTINQQFIDDLQHNKQKTLSRNKI